MDTDPLPPAFTIQVIGRPRTVGTGVPPILEAGERITLVSGIYHAFHPETEGCGIGEVSTANDDVNDNFFVDPFIGRFPGIEEEEPSAFRLCGDVPQQDLS